MAVCVRWVQVFPRCARRSQWRGDPPVWPTRTPPGCRPTVPASD